MITDDNKLKVFEGFFIDSEIQKKRTKQKLEKAKADPDYLPPPKDEVSFGPGPGPTFLQMPQEVEHGEWSSRRDDRTAYGEYLDYLCEVNPTFGNITRKWFAGFFMVRNKKTKNIIKYESIDNFFVNIKNAILELDIEQKNVTFYTKLVEEARSTGQIALAEILVSKKNVITRELAIVNNEGPIKYVEEADVVKFYNETKDTGKFVKLTWLRNYTRIIPKDLIKLKDEYDKKLFFDNYVILHFDKTGDASAMTNKEKEKAKDPIIFGMIQGSRKLYYVGDWIDEYCDLTLSKFLKAIEKKKAKNLTNRSIRTEARKIGTE